jgi:hypothetical protein
VESSHHPAYSRSCSMTFGLGKKTRLASFLSIVTESACGTMRQFGDWSITCPEPKELRTPIEGLKRRLPGLPLSSAANHDSTSPAPSHTLPEQRPTYFGLSNPPGQQCPPPIIPVEPAEPPAPHLPRFRALVLFRRLSSAHLHPGVMQASKNLHKSSHWSRHEPEPRAKLRRRKSSTARLNSPGASQ